MRSVEEAPEPPNAASWTRLQMDDPALHLALSILRRGGVVAMPTETVYGLAADASNADAVTKIFSLKGRPQDHPVIVHLAEARQITTWARDIPESAWRLAQAFWPGPLTLILKRAHHVLDAVTGGQDTVGLRVPGHPVAHALLAHFNRGLAAPSANRFGRISPTTAEHVRSEFGEAVECVLDGGPCSVGLESTILDLTGDAPRMLRPGHISARDLASVLGVHPSGAGELSPRVPGALVSHYAPRTPLLCVERRKLAEAVLGYVENNQRVAMLARGAVLVEHPLCHRQLMPDAATQYARELYSQLRAADSLAAAVILVEAPPETPVWAAIRDRLGRAASA